VFASGFVLLFVGFFVLVIVMIVVAAIQSKRRREALQGMAAQRGWQFVERNDAWCERFSVSPFGLGHNRQARNLLLGTHDGRSFVVFDHVYHTTETSTDSNGNTSSREVSHTNSVCALDLQTVFPQLQVTPEGFFGRIVGRLTNRDIELESEDFNRAFTVTCPDRKFASDILHPRMMGLLLNNRGGSFAFDAGSILNIEGGATDLPTIDARLGFLDAVVDLVPEFVWNEARGEAGPPPARQ